MKKLVSILLVLISLFSWASAMPKYEHFDLEPGLYEVGRDKDIPTGKYDIRFLGLDHTVTITYSDGYELKDGKPDTENCYQSFSFTFSSNQNWWNPGGFVVTLFPGYLLIEDSPVRLWVEK